MSTRNAYVYTHTFRKSIHTCKINFKTLNINLKHNVLLLEEEYCLFWRFFFISFTSILDFVKALRNNIMGLILMTMIQFKILVISWYFFICFIEVMVNFSFVYQFCFSCTIREGEHESGGIGRVGYNQNAFMECLKNQ